MEKEGGSGEEEEEGGGEGRIGYCQCSEKGVRLMVPFRYAKYLDFEIIRTAYLRTF